MMACLLRDHTAPAGWLARAGASRSALRSEAPAGTRLHVILGQELKRGEERRLRRARLLLELEKLLDHIRHIARLPRNVVNNNLGVGAVCEPVACRLVSAALGQKINVLAGLLYGSSGTDIHNIPEASDGA